MILAVGCAAGGRTLSPSLDADLTVGYKSEMEVISEVTATDGPAGGIIGTIGGEADSIALWLAIVALGVVALSAYPLQRALRLGWRSSRGPSGRPGSGRDMSVQFSEWKK